MATSMPPDEPSEISQPSLEYEARLPKARRVVTIPRWLYLFHRMLLGNVAVFSVVYGILVMSVGWAFKVGGVVFVIEPK